MWIHSENFGILVKQPAQYLLLCRVLTVDLDIDGVCASKQRALISTRNREPAFN